MSGSSGKPDVSFKNNCCIMVNSLKIKKKERGGSISIERSTGIAASLLLLLFLQFQVSLMGVGWDILSELDLFFLIPFPRVCSQL